MKKTKFYGILLVSLFASACMTACLGDGEEGPEVVSREELTLTMASRKVKVRYVPAEGYPDDVEACAVRKGDAPEWEPFFYEIEGFGREDGLEYVLRVSETVYFDSRLMDSRTYKKYRLLDIVSAEQRESEGLPEAFEEHV